MPYRPIAPLLTVTLGALLLAGTVQAQVYRSVGPDGRVTFSDKPPAPAAAPVAGGAATAGGGGAGLPYELNQTVQRFPVTLYSSKDCAPCNSGRNLLINRGVPFNEKTVESNEDIAALQRLAGGANSLPLLTIGGQQLKGYSDAEWSQYLDAAGYPKTSQLPRSYRRPAATPLVARQAATAPTAAPAEATEPVATPAEPSVAPQRNTSNPAGIRF